MRRFLLCLFLFAFANMVQAATPNLEDDLALIRGHLTDDNSLDVSIAFDRIPKYPNLDKVAIADFLDEFLKRKDIGGTGIELALDALGRLKCERSSELLRGYLKNPTLLRAKAHDYFIVEMILMAFRKNGDFKDFVYVLPYLKGHSERTTRFAMGTAAELARGQAEEVRDSLARQIGEVILNSRDSDTVSAGITSLRILQSFESIGILEALVEKNPDYAPSAYFALTPIAKNLLSCYKQLTALDDDRGGGVLH